MVGFPKQAAVTLSVLILAISSAFALVSEPLQQHSPFTLSLGTGTKPLEDIEEMVFDWISLGGRSIDTALLYTGAHEAIRDALRRLASQNITRNDVVITSKVPGILTFNDTVSAVEECLTQLDTNYVDLMLIHWPCDTSTPSTNCTSTPNLKSKRLETWAALESLKQQGTVREIGVSNYNREQVEEIVVSQQSSILPFVNQVEWHLGHHDQGMLHYLKSHRITLQAYSALSGFSYPAVSLSNPDVTVIADVHNVSTAQIALRWSVQQSVFVITSTTHSAYMSSDMDIFSFELSGQDMQALSSLKPGGRDGMN